MHQEVLEARRSEAKSQVADDRNLGNSFALLQSGLPLGSLLSIAAQIVFYVVGTHFGNRAK